MSAAAELPARIAVDQSACTRSQADIGQTVMHNICSGETSIVPWGSGDWLGFVAICGFGLTIALLFGGLALLIIKSIRDGY